MQYFAQYRSPIGPLLLLSDGKNLTGLWMTRAHGEADQRDNLPIFRLTKAWLDDYFAGRNPPVSAIPLSPSGTPFQRQVWEILLRIPLGETRTYGDIAREMAQQLGREKMSAQAVGGAVGRNPVSILIPCHRVVGANHQLTGYAGGLDKKLWLLRHEGWKY